LFGLKENLLKNVQNVSGFLVKELKDITEIKKIKGRGLMLGVELDFPVREIREKLLFEHQILTGSSANPNLLRILPPLNITREQISIFPVALREVLNGINNSNKRNEK